MNSTPIKSSTPVMLHDDDFKPLPSSSLLLNNNGGVVVVDEALPEDTIKMLETMLIAKEAELEEMRKLQANSSTVASSPLASVTPPMTTTTTTTTGGGDVVVEGSTEQVAVLIRQLNEANMRNRRDEKRAKVREEELLKQIELEAKRAEDVKREVESQLAEVEQIRDKMKDANRKKAQAIAQTQSLKSELEEATKRLTATDLEKRRLEEELSASRNEAETARGECLNLKLALDERAGENAELVRIVEELKGEREARLAAESAVATLQNELAASEARNEKIKQTSKHTVQLVKDLQNELAKMKASSGTVGTPTQLNNTNSSPRASSTNSTMNNTPSTPRTPTVDDRLLRDLAARLESLLRENAGLKERVAFLEEGVQSLTRELEGYKAAAKKTGGTITPLAALSPASPLRRNVGRAATPLSVAGASTIKAAPGHNGNNNNDGGNASAGGTTPSKQYIL